MRVEILFFAVLRERAGRERETLDLPDGADVAAARAAVAARHPGIEALLPPVAGGAGPRKIAIRAEPLTVDETVEAVAGPNRGGVVTFTGVVRREGHHLPDVVRLEYEAYVEMAEQVLAEIAEEIEREWAGTEIAIHHRIGKLGVGEIAVAITAASAHRAPAFEACRAAIDRLKERAPIWKKEVGASGEAWLGLGP